MLSTQEKTSFLRKVSAFEELTDEQLCTLAEICNERSFSQGDKIFRQGDIGGVLHIVVSGKVTIERELQQQSNKVSIMQVEPYDYLGEMSLFYDAPRSVAAAAMEDTITLEIENDHFMEIIRHDPDLLMEFCRVLSVRLCEAYDKIAEANMDKKPRELHKLYDKLDF